MFSWVCPRCGHDVPPSKTVCPFCEPVAAPPIPEASQPHLSQPPSQQPPSPYPPAPQYWQPQAPPLQYQGPQPPQYQQAWPQQPPPQQPQPPQQYWQPPQPQYVPPPPPHVLKPAPWAAEEQHRAGKPQWLIALLAFAGVIVIFGAAYLIMGNRSSSTAKEAAKQATANPMQKYIEVVGIRLLSDRKGQSVKFVVVSHSGVELTDLDASVNLWASTARSEEDTVGSFAFHLGSLGPNESKELTAPLKTDRKPSEMPEDWSGINAEVQITAPR